MGGMWALICLVAAAVRAATGAAGCDVTIGDDTYRKETLLSNASSPQGLALDYTNTLYYTYHKRLWFTAKLDLQTKAVKELKELPTYCEFTVDETRTEVYAGCYGEGDGRFAGIYTFDSNVGEFVRAGEAERHVRFLHYYNNALYYSYSEGFLLQAFRAGRSARVQEVQSEILNLAVARHTDWIYRNSSGVYRQRAGATTATRYKGLDDPRTVGVDASGHTAYACDYGSHTGGLYRLHEYTSSVTKIQGVGPCSGITFDVDNNIIYGDLKDNKIVRLVAC